MGDGWNTVLWLLLVLKDVCAEDPRDCRDFQQAAANTTVSIRCPSRDKEEVTYTLSRGVSKLHTSVVKGKQVQNHTEEWARFHLAEHNLTNYYEFTINCTGVYSCVVEGWDPPYSEDTVETVLLVGETCPPLCNQNPAIQDPNSYSLANQSCTESNLVMWLVLGGVTTYSVFITLVGIFVWCKWKTEASTQSDYINTKPGEFCRPHKVHLPIRGRF